MHEDAIHEHPSVVVTNPVIPCTSGVSTHPHPSGRLVERAASPRRIRSDSIGAIRKRRRGGSPGLRPAMDPWDPARVLVARPRHRTRPADRRGRHERDRGREARARLRCARGGNRRGSGAQLPSPHSAAPVGAERGAGLRRRGAPTGHISPRPRRRYRAMRMLNRPSTPTGRAALVSRSTSSSETEAPPRRLHAKHTARAAYPEVYGRRARAGEPGWGCGGAGVEGLAVDWRLPFIVVVAFLAQTRWIEPATAFDIMPAQDRASQKSADGSTEADAAIAEPPPAVGPTCLRRSRGRRGALDMTTDVRAPCILLPSYFYFF